MSLGREVLVDRSEARQESLRAFRVAEARHRPAPAFTRRLMAIFGTVVHPCTGFDENMFDAMRETGAKLVSPAPDRLVTDEHASLEQQLFNITQAQREAHFGLRVGFCYCPSHCG